MTASARNLLWLMLATAAGWILESQTSAAMPKDEAPSSIALPELSEPTVDQEAAPGMESEPGPKNVIHLLPPPVVNESSPHRGSDRPVPAQPGKARSSYSPDRMDETAAFSVASARATTPQDLVRERAAQRDLERRRRIEGRRWIGYEPARPLVSTTPFMSGTNWQPMVVPSTVPDYGRN